MIPVASVVTQKSLTEFLLLKLSLEQYHDVMWYLSVDEYTFSKLSPYKNIRLQKLVKTDDCSHGTNDPVKNRLFLELVMTKFDAMKAAISDYGYGVFIDSDIFFTAPIEDRVLDLMKNPSIDAVLSPHMTNNLGLESQVGHFNVGFFSMRNLEYLKLHQEMSWRHKELGMYYEQQPLQFSSYNFLTVNLPIYYNVGWWRFNENHSKVRLNFLVEDGKDVYFDGNKVVCFHVHALKQLDYTNYGKFFMDKIMTLMKNCDNKKYSELLQYIESNSENFSQIK
jgi:hypothetical protein